MADRNGVEIDYCPKCRGIWLDRGELDKIIERSGASVNPNAGYSSHQQPYQHQHYDKKGYIDPKHRKKNFLEDLFDF